jgi:hypothetical protein
MGGECSTHWAVIMRTKFWLENLKGAGHSKDISVDGRIILKWILGKDVWGVKWNVAEGW